MQPTRQQCINRLVIGFWELVIAIYERGACRLEMGQAARALDKASQLVVRAVRNGVESLDDVGDGPLLEATKQGLAELGRVARMGRLAVSSDILDALESCQTLIPVTVDGKSRHRDEIDDR